jgi:hypothetical protein
MPRNRSVYLATWKNIEDVYEIWTDMGEIDNTDVTDYDALQVLKELDERRGRKRGLQRGVKYGDPYETQISRDERASIVEWLSNRWKYSPVVDEVALARFAHSRSKAHYDALTRREQRLAEQRLPPQDVTNVTPEGWTGEEWSLLRGRANRKREYRNEKAAA